MARVKRGVTAHRRHKRLLQDAEGRKGTRSRLIRPAREALLHAMAYATRDRKQRKRKMRELWIIRINAAARQNGLTYGQFVAGMKKADIQLDLGLAQALHEAAVGEAVLTGGRVDPDDPQLAHLALALLAVAGSVGERVEERFARRLDQPGLRALAALGRVQEALVALVRGDAALDSCHSCGLEVRQQALDLLL